MRTSPVSQPSPRRAFARARWEANQRRIAARQEFLANQHALAVQRVAQASGLI